MPIESATFISDLVPANPPGTDALSTAADHLRLTKSVVKATFPNIVGALTASNVELNYVTGVTSAIQTQLITPTAVASINGGSVGGFRNKLINGLFRTNRRGYVSGTALAVGVPATGVGYAHDGWRAGTLNSAYTFVQSAISTTITITAGTLITAAESYFIDSGTMVLGWGGTATARVGINGAAPSGAYAVSPIAISCTPGQQVSVEFATGTLLNVQLENGQTASRVEYPTPELQDIRCQRLLPSITCVANSAFGVGQAILTTRGLVRVSFPVQARISPTGLIAPAAASFYLTDASYNAKACTAIALTYPDPYSGLLQADVASGLVAGNATILATTGTYALSFTGAEL